MMDIRLVDNCQYGTMSDVRREYKILKNFEKNCLGKGSCLLPIDVDSFFGVECKRDIADRIAEKPEKLAYGPPRLYSMVQCNYDTAGESLRQDES